MLYIILAKLLDPISILISFVLSFLFRKPLIARKVWTLTTVAILSALLYESLIYFSDLGLRTRTFGEHLGQGVIASFIHIFIFYIYFENREKKRILQYSYELPDDNAIRKDLQYQYPNESMDYIEQKLAYLKDYHKRNNLPYEFFQKDKITKDN